MARLPASGPNVSTTSAGGRPCPAAATSQPPSNPTCSAVTSQPSSTTSGRLASPGEGHDHAGHGVDRFGVGQAVVDAQRSPGRERGGVADDRAQPATIVPVAAERPRENVAEVAVPVAQALLVRL